MLSNRPANERDDIYGPTLSLLQASHSPSKGIRPFGEKRIPTNVHSYTQTGERKVMIFFNRRIHTTFLWNADTSSEAKDFGKTFYFPHFSVFSTTIFTFPAVSGAWCQGRSQRVEWRLVSSLLSS